MRTHTCCFGCGQDLIVQAGDPAGYLSHVDCAQPVDPVTVMRTAMLAAIKAGDDADADHWAAKLDEWDDHTPDMARAAERYATWGWPIFPLVPGRKTPIVDSGLNAATTDIEKIKDWWWRWPHAGIGAATGWMFDVIDIDGADGQRWLGRLNEPGDDTLPDIHARAGTPRGEHLYLTPSGRGNLAGLASGVDYRGKGGYVVLPPTRLTEDAYKPPPPEGRLAYTWTHYPSPAIKRKGAAA